MGGNVFKDEPYTMRINKVDVVPTSPELKRTIRAYKLFINFTIKFGFYIYGTGQMNFH